VAGHGPFLRPGAGIMVSACAMCAMIITTPWGWPARDADLPQGEPARDVLAGQWRGLQSEGSGSPAPGLGLTRASIGLTRAGGCGTAPDCGVRPVAGEPPARQYSPHGGPDPRCRRRP